MGSNIPPRRAYLEKAAELVRERIGKVVSVSKVYETEAWGFIAESFLNQSLIVKTTLNAEQILEETQAVERLLGRKKKTTAATGYASRTMDIDLIFFNDEILATDRLQIPHPRMAQRRFVLATLKDIMPEYIHPVFKQSILTLYRTCEDTSKVVETVSQ